MKDLTPIRDPNLQLLVQDFDALAELVQNVIDGNHRCARHETVPANDMEFTTEWQMDWSAEMAHTP